MKKSPLVALAAIATAATLALTGCVAGEDAPAEPAGPALGEGGWSASELNIDFATYNPLSLIIKDQGWLEEATGGDVTINWIQSAGSNKANEFLRAGSLDVGSTAGSAALLARSNGSPIKVIDIYSQPNWAAIAVPAGSDITEVDDLVGKRIAVTKGTDPYFFLLQTLDEAGIGLDEVTIENLQHADGKAALESGAVDAWSGLDPLLSTSVETAGTEIIYDNIDFNSYGFLNATESFLQTSPDLAQLVVNAYEAARAWAIENPEETAAILAEVAAIDPAIASAVILDRTNLEVSGVPGDAQVAVLEIIGPIFVANGDVPTQDQIDDALASLLEPTYAEDADPAFFD
ncbi:aliphatic sulfonate ABC transporter substrate-binding protein [Pseudolysinimonas sp.]|jgi:sulfonate transport system substrate-binding protein|uniref:aliphatic sulfonate ABC transporter substrate-binding protein n=1 Tax=Pseudolysinimonas sp. TaxID=2680009 RepID=UPI00378355ED